MGVNFSANLSLVKNNFDLFYNCQRHLIFQIQIGQKKCNLRSSTFVHCPLNIAQRHLPMPLQGWFDKKTKAKHWMFWDTWERGGSKKCSWCAQKTHDLFSSTYQKSVIGQSTDVSMLHYNSTPCSFACLHAHHPTLLRLNINQFLSVKVMADNCKLQSESEKMHSMFNLEASTKMISERFCENDWRAEMPIEWVSV